MNLYFCSTKKFLWNRLNNEVCGYTLCIYYNGRGMVITVRTANVSKRRPIEAYGGIPENFCSKREATSNNSLMT